MTTLTRLGELTGDYVLDTGRTRIGFVAKHTVGGRARGRFEEFDGRARLDGDDPSASSVRLTIRAASFETGSGPRDRLVRKRYLDVAEHPAVTFVSTRIAVLDDTAFRVTGDLTIRGVTRPITLDFHVTGANPDAAGGARVTAEARKTIDRHDWGVNQNAMSRLLVGSAVELEIEVTAVRRS